jgi:hypothetical protein
VLKYKRDFMKKYLTLVAIVFFLFTKASSQNKREQTNTLVTSLIQYVDDIKKGSVIWISEPEMNEQKRKVIALVDEYQVFSQDTPQKLFNLSAEIDVDDLKKILDKYSSDRESLISRLMDWKNQEKLDTLILRGDELEKLNLMMKELMKSLRTKNDYDDPLKVLLAEDLVYYQINQLASKFIFILNRLKK